MASLAVAEYIDEIQSQLASGHAREHAYRPALQRLMRSYKDVEAINDPAQSENGAPDFIFQRESNRDIILGYAEAKDIGVNLDRVEKSEQMQRYAGYQNLFLTDYLEFRFFENGEAYRKIRIGKVKNGVLVPDALQYERLEDELKDFLALPPQRITNGKRLAEIMGAKARRIRDDIVDYFSEEPAPSGDLTKVLDLMRQLLVHDLDERKFADMYAQTLVYGLFVARYNDPTPDTFTRDEARLLVPKTNPFLRHFFDHIAGPKFEERLARAVDELCEVFKISALREIVHRHLNGSKAYKEKDPVIHFYEDFLQAYDPKLRRGMGAYYTPLPVAKYIVRKVDEVLKNDFKIPKGLADAGKIKKVIDDGQLRTYKDHLTRNRRTTTGQEIEYHRVQILDPAVGTATFLNEIVKYVYAGFAGQEGRWPAYVNEDLIPRLQGFELMMAPYTIAHLKLGMEFEETGVTDIRRRLGVYLTNTLEEGRAPERDLLNFGLAEIVSEESREAGLIKTERPIMVVVGNPPYSASSKNQSAFILKLVAEYREGLNEKKVNFNDDYIKFIRFAEHMVQTNGEGVMAYITNNSYIGRVTHRSMRRHLLETFNDIYILDLHGNSFQGETSPDGSDDQNVFDIQQGVAITIAVRSSGKQDKSLGKVHFAELYGKRSDKFAALASADFEWQTLTPEPPYYFFTAKDLSEAKEYASFIPLPDIFPTRSSGIETQDDKNLVAATSDEILDQLRKLADDQSSKYFDAFKKNPIDPGRVVKFENKLFDTRYTYLDRKILGRSRLPFMSSMANHPNLAIATARQLTDRELPGAFVFANAAAHKSFSSNDKTVLFPLYIYSSEEQQVLNMAPTVIARLVENVKEGVSSEEVFDYIYGTLNSPYLLARFKELMKIDFPRVPIPANFTEFQHFSRKGAELRELHTMTSPLIEQYGTTFPTAGSNKVESVRRNGEEVWINDGQHFGNVPAVAWDIQIGGYQPAQKWLKDRTGRILSNDEIDHYQRVIRVLGETARIMKEIDSVPASWR
ncbi:DNA methyltransferase [Rhodococcus hoagii]|nr:DNA methyltransferase [Prescottella equi]